MSLRESDAAGLLSFSSSVCILSWATKEKDSSILAAVACMDTCTSPYLLPYLLPVPFLSCISLSADSDPFIRKQIKCRWPTAKCSHLYSAATTSEVEGLLIDQHWYLALDQNQCPRICLRGPTHPTGSWYHFFCPGAKNCDRSTSKNHHEASVCGVKI